MRNILLIIFMFVTTSAIAQSSRGDMFFAEGVGLQKVQSVSSQKSAIHKFKQAKVAYRNASKKKECDACITACENTIKRLQKKPKPTPEPQMKNDTLETDTTMAVTQLEVAVEVELSVSTNRIDFKADPKETPVVKVSCNYDGWEISSKPEWLKVYVAPGEFSVIAEENKGDDRSGIIDVTCQNKTVRVIVNQSKLKGIKGFFKKLK